MWCENFSIYCYWLHWHWSWPSWWRWHHQTSNWFMVLFSACYESRVFKEVVIVIISNVGSCHVLSWCLTHSRPSLISHQNQSIWSEKNQNWCDILWKLKRTTLWCYVVGWKSSSVEGGTSPPPGWSCHWPARTVRCHSSHRTCARSSWHPTWQPQCCHTLDAGSSESNWMFCSCCTPTLHEPWILKSKVSFLIM